MKYISETIGITCSVLSIPVLLASHNAAGAAWAFTALLWTINSAVLKARQ